MGLEFSCIIVDDEPKAGFVLNELIKMNFPKVEIIGVCKNLLVARSLMIERQPSLVFLDIQLPGELGLDLITNQENRNFAVVLTTAHEEYALKAFELGVQDYLLKPIDSVRLTKAMMKVDRYLSALKTDVLTEKASLLNTSRVISLSLNKGIELINSDSIIRFEGSGSYSFIHFVKRKKELLTMNLKRIEELLNLSNFCRVHNSHLINLKHVKRIERVDGGVVLMSDGSRVAASRRKMNTFLQLINTSVFWKETLR